MALYSAFAQECVSRVSSYTSEFVDVASRENRVQMVEMAVSRLELAIERSGKLPITDVSLLRRRQMIQRVCTEGKELLRTHKQQLEDREEVGQVVTASSFLERFTHAANRPIMYLSGLNKGYLSSSAVKKFEMFAEWADKFLQDVESGCTLRQYMLSNNSFIRLLFEWRTLGFGTKKGTFLQRGLAIWATRSEEHGVEASLVYGYEDPKMPQKSFVLKLGLTLSESTDIVGTAIRCLQPLATQSKVAAESAFRELSQQVATQYKVAAESAIGELSQQVTSGNLLELSPSREHALAPLKKDCAYTSHIFRLHPNAHGLPSANNTVSSELSHMLPEEVNYFEFNFKVRLEEKCSLRRSSDEAGRSVMLPPELEAISISHFLHLRGVNLHRVEPVEGSISVDFGSNRKSRLLSMQEWVDTLHRRELTRYGIHWFSKHGAALFDVKRPTSRRSAKRKR